MKAIRDPEGILANALAGFPERFELPVTFPPEVLKEAGQAAARQPDASSHADRLDVPFVTLDPASSTDLDQAFHVEVAGDDIRLHYAIADVGWFVLPGSALDEEAWKRGMTVYMPGSRIGLYPPVLSENAASLLPDGPRPCVLFRVLVSQNGEARIEGVERARIRSRAKLAYETASEDDLPDGAIELARRIEAAEKARGASRVDPPEQEMQALGEGRYALTFRPRRRVEDINACFSMATNLAVARLFLDHRAGLFRIMAEPSADEVAKLRRQAAAFGLGWRDGESLEAFEKRLDPNEPAAAAMMLAIRRAGHGASYAPFVEGKTPWHAAIAGSYVHATAPLRRLADRYVVEAALALANGNALPDPIARAFERLPRVMARAGQLASRVERAAVDVAEAVLLAPHHGKTLTATVISSDESRSEVQVQDLPVLLAVPSPDRAPGETVTIRIEHVDTTAGRIEARIA